MLHKIIYKIGIDIRNNRIKSNLAFLQKSEFWTLKGLEEYQNKKLKELVTIAYNDCPYYKNKFCNIGLTPSDIKSIKDISLIPTTNKSELLSNSEEIQRQVIGEKEYYSETSGSTGKPLVFFRNQDWDAWHNASVIRGYRWFRIDPWDRNGYLWGYNFSTKDAFSTKIFDFLQNRFRLFSYSDEEIAKFCHKLKRAKYLHGYSSMIYELAKYVDHHPSLKRKINLAMIKGTSEKIFDTYQVKVKSAFGRRIVNEYGAAEAGIIAFECPQGNMHVNMETVVVEEIDKHIVVTNLVSKSFPIIRYELGDYIELDRDTICSCGRKAYIIKEITGRVGKKIQGFNDTYPSLTLYYIFKNIAINHDIKLNYQAVQKTKGEIDFRIEKELSEEERQLITDEIKKYFKDDIWYRILDRETLIARDGKTKDFVSELE